MCDNGSSDDEKCCIYFVSYSDKQCKQLGDCADCQGKAEKWYSEEARSSFYEEDAKLNVRFIYLTFPNTNVFFFPYICLH